MNSSVNIAANHEALTECSVAPRTWLCSAVAFLNQRVVLHCRVARLDKLGSLQRVALNFCLMATANECRDSVEFSSAIKLSVPSTGGEQATTVCASERVRRGMRECGGVVARVV